MNPKKHHQPGSWRLPWQAAVVSLLLSGPLQTTRADYPSTVLSQGPVGYWRLEESVQPQPMIVTAVDLGTLGTTGNGKYFREVDKGQPGALGGGSTATASGFSNPGMEVTFLGAFVDVDYQAGLNPSGPFAVEFWAKPSAAFNDLFSPVASLDARVGREGYLFYEGADTPGGAAHWQFRVGDSTGYTGSAIGGPVTPNAWHHVVGVYDGSQVILYINGTQAAAAAAASFTPNGAAPFRIGATTIPNREWDGLIQEVAFYPHVLTPAEVLAHYNKGLTDGNGYPAAVLAGNPAGYWRLGEAADPPIPVAANAGTLGSAVDGSYLFGTTPGKPGPSHADFPGFPAGNKAVGLNGESGVVTLPALNLNTNTITISAWVFADGVQGHDTGIVFTRTVNTVAGLKTDQSDPNGLAYNWNDVALADGFKSSLTMPQGKWSFVALTVQPDVAVLALHDGVAFNFVTNFDVANIVLPFEGEWHIGNDALDETNVFKGSIDEVAIFNRALSLGELYTQYAAAAGGLGPQIFLDPQSPATDISVGETLTLSVDAGGTPDLTYQWSHGTSVIPGATGPTFTKANATIGDAGDYKVKVSNGFGSLTSQAATVGVVQLTTPAITASPAGRSIYPGGSITLSVSATGGRLSYQWQKDTVAIQNATNSTLVLSNIKGTDTGSYSVVVSNSLGSAPSDPAVVTVVVPKAGSYEAAVVADGPEGWWRLAEGPGATTLFDSVGRHDGVYVGNGVIPGGPGVLHSGTGTSASFDGTASYGRIPYSPDLNARTNFTAEVWVKSEVNATEIAAMSSYSLSGDSGRGYAFIQTPGDVWWGITGNADNFQYYYQPMGDVTLTRWVQLVIVGDQFGVSFYYNGRFIDGPFTSYVRNVSAPFLIGARNNDGAIHQYFEGEIAEASYYLKPLSAEQIKAHYVAALYGGDTAPQFLQQPVAATVAVGQDAKFAAVVEGSEPLTLQWTKDNKALDGETNATLTVTNADFSAKGDYRLEATNPVGKKTSDPAKLNVVPVPVSVTVSDSLVLHMAFENDYKDASGRGNNGTAVGAPTFVDGKVGAKALHYNTDTDKSIFNYVDLGKPPDLNFGTSTDFSVAYWVRIPKDDLTGDLPFLCNAQNSYSNPGFTFAPSYQAGGWSWSLGSAGLYGPDGSINDGEWHHLVHTFSRTGKGITYLDGVDVDESPATASGDLTTGDSTSIGQDPTGAYGESGSADLDDLGIWRRVLTPFEVYSIYHVGSEYGVSFDGTPGTVVLTILTQTDGSHQLVWATGTLQSSSRYDGGWANVPNSPTAPYTLPTAGDGTFYRVILTPGGGAAATK